MRLSQDYYYYQVYVVTLYYQTRAYVVIPFIDWFTYGHRFPLLIWELILKDYYHIRLLFGWYT